MSTALGFFVGPLGALPLPWPFERTYMQLALAAGLVVGLCAPLIGAFLVQRRMSLMGDGVGHLAFAGVAGGLLADVWPVWTALLVTVVGALAVERLRAASRASGDLALALIFYGGIAAGTVLMGLSSSLNASVVSYLFGSILTVSPGDVWVVVAIGLLVVAVIAVCGPALFAIVLDEDAARVAGLPVAWLNAALACLTAVVVVAAMRVVGILLVSALMVLPVGTGQLVTRSFRAMVAVSAGIGAVSVVAGLVAARVWSLAPGGTIVLVAAGAFAVSAAVSARARGAVTAAAPPDPLHG